MTANTKRSLIAVLYRKPGHRVNDTLMFPSKARVVWQWRLSVYCHTFLLPAILQLANNFTNISYLASLQNFASNCLWATFGRCKETAMSEERGSNSLLQQALNNHATAKRGVCTQHPQGLRPVAVQSAGRQTEQEFRGLVYFRTKNYPFASGKSNRIFNVQP